MATKSKKRERTCVACGTRSDKVELYRIVRKADGRVCFDPSGRVAGRGAYVCSTACLDEALSKKKLNRALRADVGSNEAASIASELEKALSGAGAR